MIVELLNAGGGEPKSFESDNDTAVDFANVLARGSDYGNETSVHFANATADTIAGNLTEDRSMGVGRRRAAEIEILNGFENNWWELAPESTRTAFKKCCVDQGTMDEACISNMCDWESSGFSAEFSTNQCQHRHMYCS